MATTNTVNIHEAKTHLSRLLERVAAGDEIIIAKAGTSIAKLTSVHAKRKALPYGLLKGKLKVKAGFDDPLPDDFIAGFEGR
jgi:prevent-host-death family protein